MKKGLFALFIALPFYGFSQELPYSLTVLNEEYVNLSEAGSVVDGEVWDDPQATIPLGFQFQIMDEVISDILLVGPGGQIVSMIKQDSIHFMAPYLADLMDAGYDSTSISPLLYTTEGNPGNRIFKLEYRNSGFYAEWFESGTFDNRISFQMWLYEGSNVIEYRFGENTVTQGTLVHFAGAPLIGLGSNADAAGNGGWENFWLLYGDPLAPQIYNLQSQFEIPLILDAEPPAGTVYRFAPLFTNVNENNTSSYSGIYPTLVDTQLTINWNDDQTMANVMDISGKLISTHIIQRGINQLDLSALSVGQYIIQIVSDEIHVKQRITKL